MARITVFVSICLAFLVIGTNAAGMLHVLHSPDSIQFSGASQLSESTLPDVFTAALGYTLSEDSDWNGMSIADPFDVPEAIVEVSVDGVSGLGKNVQWKSKDYPMVVDISEPDVFETVAHRIKQRSQNAGNILVNVKLQDTKELNSHSDVFGKIGHIKPAKQNLQYLKYTNDVDHQFLTELEALKIIASKVESGNISPDNVVDLYNFRFSSLRAVSDLHGSNSMQAKEAKHLLVKGIEDLEDAFNKAYDGSVLFVVVTTDTPHIRRVRAAEEGSSVTRQDTEEGAYSPDYPAIFNIILWFSVVFAFALIAIVYAIMDMDPGRDSIIYRMTSTRMKKDN